MRAALTRLFERFVIHRAPDRSDLTPEVREAAEDVARRAGEDSGTFEAGGWIIDPIPRPEAVEGWPTLQPILRREPLYQAGNKIEERFSAVERDV